MFNWKNGDGAADKAPTPEVVEAVQTAPTPAEPIERSILKDCALARDEARQRVTAREEEVARLELVVAEGDKVAATLQADIAADGAAGIAALVRGETQPNGAMTALIGIELAARAAKARLPVATAELEQAKAARERAEVEVIRAARNLMLVEVGKKVEQHRKTFAELCRLNDELIGTSYALPPIERLGQELHNLVTAIEVPGFNLGSGSYSPTMRGIPDERAIAQSTARWSAAREGLIANPDADFLAVLDEPVAISGNGSLPPGMTRSTRPATHVDAGVPIGAFGMPWNSAAT